MIREKITVNNPTGLGVEAAGIMVNLAINYRSTIEFTKGNSIANAKSVLSILGSSVMKGDEIEIICNGPDEEEALAEMIDLVQSGMDL